MAASNARQSSSGFFHVMWIFVVRLFLSFTGTFRSKPSSELPSPVTARSSPRAGGSFKQSSGPKGKAVTRGSSLPRNSRDKNIKVKARAVAKQRAASLATAPRNALSPLSTAPSLVNRNVMSDAELGQSNTVPASDHIPRHPSFQSRVASSSTGLHGININTDHLGLIQPPNFSPISTLSSPVDSLPVTPYFGYQPTFVDVVEFTSDGGITSPYLRSLGSHRGFPVTPIAISKTEYFDRLPSPWSPIEETIAPKFDKPAGMAVCNTVWTSSPKSRDDDDVVVQSVHDVSGPFNVKGGSHFAPYFDDGSSECTYSDIFDFSIYAYYPDGEADSEDISVATSESGEISSQPQVLNKLDVHLKPSNVNKYSRDVYDSSNDGANVDKETSEDIYSPTEAEWFSPSAFVNTPKILLTPPAASQNRKSSTDSFQFSSSFSSSNIQFESAISSPPVTPTKGTDTQRSPSEDAQVSSDRSARSMRCTSLPCFPTFPSTPSLPTFNSVSTLPHEPIGENRKSKALDDIISILDDYKFSFGDNRVDARVDAVLNEEMLTEGSMACEVEVV